MSIGKMSNKSIHKPEAYTSQKHGFISTQQLQLRYVIECVELCEHLI